MSSETSQKINKKIDLENQTKLMQKEFANSGFSEENAFLYNSFLRNLQIIEIVEDTYCLLTTDKELEELEKPENKSYIRRVLAEIAQKPVQVIFQTSPDVKPFIEKIQPKKQTKEIVSNINSSLTLDKYTTGEFNKNAMLGAMSVINNNTSQAIFSPLFIHAPSGFGKTHLLHAIGNELIKKGQSCFYINPDFFTRDLVVHLQNKNQDGINEIIDKCSKYDCLMFDDVQQFRSRESTLNVLFNIINNHISNKKQIIICADKTPEELGGFEERFITRFSGGITFAITQPQTEDIIKIFKFKILAAGMDPNVFDEESYKFLARNFSNSIRSIEGAVNKINLFRINDKDFRFDLSYLKFIFNASEQIAETISPDKVIDSVCKYYKVDRKDIIGKNRSKEIVVARRIAIWIIRNSFDMSYAAIGKKFGGQSHSNIINSVEEIDKEIKINTSIKMAITKIKENIKKIN
ncbi:chromosomal replication initiator protein DnaA [[Mycoplasma] gypis]|uniref:Chromosomal replication initiator protein DnaA n=1 Tax=[Mycoplasma] gypis TaxID=92404 RepID=A0ABZ2RPV0_9BACT|nr:chromosomal replication initiator protein DnaA [[Mycoplasma] gypis]MBN0919566.1 chromosomal replication initiator protein DnaA [[Mycoplasma] gypis]